VFQPGVEQALPLIDLIADDLLLPGSRIAGLDNIDALCKKAEAGSACLLLLEHYSNFDLSCFISLLRKAGRNDIAQSIVAIAGVKLNEESSMVASMAGVYSRIVICPSRSLQNRDSEKDKEKMARFQAINLAAVKVMNKIKNEGKIILVFPSGTRFRPWDPASKKAVREIDSYIKSFDYMCTVAINGEVMHIRDDGSGNMIDDYTSKDVVLCTAGSVVACDDFRKKALEAAAQNAETDKKQAVADAIMRQLDGLHTEAEKERACLL
jgi:glycerol-3-phosphate O-acyltransferase